MDFRKLIAFGKTSFVMSIPKSWVVKNKLKKGDLIAVEDKEDSLTLSPYVEGKETFTQTEIDITDLDRTSIMYFIRSVYRKGYDIINIKFNNQVCKHIRMGEETKVISIIHEEVNRLVGVEITHQKENLVVIRSISEGSIKEFDNVLRRLFLLLLDAEQDLLNGIKANDLILIATIEEKHNTISKFASYCLRMLNQKGYRESDKAFFLYHIIATLDKMADILKYCARDNILLYKKPFKKETINIIEDIHNSLRLYHTLFYKFDLETVKKLSENRDNVKERLKNMSKKHIPHEEILVINDLKQNLELLLDLTEARMSMAY